MRRFVCLLSALILALTLCACRETPQPPEPTPTTVPTETPQSTEAPTPTEAPPTETPENSPAPDDDTEAERKLEYVIRGETVSLPAKRFSDTLLETGEFPFSFVLPKNGIEAEFCSNAWYFRVSDEPEAAWLELSFIAGADGESLLPSLLDSYLDFTEVEFSTASKLGTVRGSTAHAEATDAETLAEGWLMDVDGGVVSAVLRCPRDQRDSEYALLKAVLDTFGFEN